MGQCVLTLPNITSGDAGPYLVIFPGKVGDPAVSSTLATVARVMTTRSLTWWFRVRK